MIYCTQSTTRDRVSFNFILGCFFSPFLSSFPPYISVSIASKEAMKMGWNEELQLHHFMMSTSALATLIEQENMLRGSADGKEMQEGGKVGDGNAETRHLLFEGPTLLLWVLGLFKELCGLELSKVHWVNSLEGLLTLILNKCLWIQTVQFMMNRSLHQRSWDKWHSDENWKENFIYKSYSDTDLFGFVWKRTCWSSNIHSINIY